MRRLSDLQCSFKTQPTCWWRLAATAFGGGHVAGRGVEDYPSARLRSECADSHPSAAWSIDNYCAAWVSSAPACSALADRRSDTVRAIGAGRLTNRLGP